MITNVAGRRTRSLAGRWRAILDPYDAGSTTPWGDPSPFGWFRNLPVRPGIAEYDFERAELLHVPGDWNSQSERFLYYEGSVWYKTEFDAPAQADARSAPDARRFLHFGAANYEAKVWLNGELLGEHEGGFTPFEFELTGRTRDAGNVLIVRVNNRRRAEGVPGLQTDWWNYGGLTRDVSLVELPATFVRHYAVWLAEPGRVRAWVELDGARREQEITLRIPELGAEALARADARGRAELELDADLELWSPERPRLYTVEIAAETDRVRERIGFRTIETRGREILLNGRPVFLRGICLHEESPARPGRACGPDDARALLGLARELGCNFVRLAHYPHDEWMARSADELGLLVWEELPVYWALAWDDPRTLASALRQLEELVARDRNRASVVLWSLANECPASEPRLRFLGELARRVRELDPTRLVTAALMGRLLDGLTRLVLDDPLGARLDVLGCNEYFGWYYGDPEKLDQVRFECPYEKPVIVSEFGADAPAGRHGSRGEIFTEENQAFVYEQQLALLARLPFVRGISPWILRDFRSPRRVLAGIQDGWNRKGLISDRGQRKQAFGVLQAFYRERAARE